MGNRRYYSKRVPASRRPWRGHGSDKAKHRVAQIRRDRFLHLCFLRWMLDTGSHSIWRFYDENREEIEEYLAGNFHVEIPPELRDESVPPPIRAALGLDV